MWMYRPICHILYITHRDAEQMGGFYGEREQGKERTTSKCLLISYIVKGSCTKKKMGAYASHSHTDIRVYSRCWEYFVSAKAVPPHVGEGINHSCEDTFRGICKPTVFTLFPYGNIRRRFLERHSCTEEKVRSGSTQGQLFSVPLIKFYFLLRGRWNGNVATFSKSWHFWIDCT